MDHARADVPRYEEAGGGLYSAPDADTQRGWTVSRLCRAVGEGAGRGLKCRLVDGQTSRGIMRVGDTAATCFRWYRGEDASTAPRDAVSFPPGPRTPGFEGDRHWTPLPRVFQGPQSRSIVLSSCPLVSVSPSPCSSATSRLGMGCRASVIYAMRTRRRGRGFSRWTAVIPRAAVTCATRS